MGVDKDKDVGVIIPGDVPGVPKKSLGKMSLSIQPSGKNQAIKMPENAPTKAIKMHYWLLFIVAVELLVRLDLVSEDDLAINQSGWLATMRELAGRLFHDPVCAEDDVGDLQRRIAECDKTTESIGFILREVTT